MFQINTDGCTDKLHVSNKRQTKTLSKFTLAPLSPKKTTPW